MNSKLIAIIAVVAMCGAALVGVGYAYQATYVGEQNSVVSESNYIALEQNATKVELSADVSYDTKNNAGTKKVDLISVSAPSGKVLTQDIVLTLKAVNDAEGTYNIGMTIAIPGADDEKAAAAKAMLDMPVGTAFTCTWKYGENNTGIVTFEKTADGKGITATGLPTNVAVSKNSSVTITFTYAISGTAQNNLVPNANGAAVNTDGWPITAVNKAFTVTLTATATSP